jgi:hypothetical protein
MLVFSDEGPRCTIATLLIRKPSLLLFAATGVGSLRHPPPKLPEQNPIPKVLVKPPREQIENSWTNCMNSGSVKSQKSTSASDVTRLCSEPQKKSFSHNQSIGDLCIVHVPIVTTDVPFMSRLCLLWVDTQIVKSTSASEVNVLRSEPQNRSSFHFPPTTFHPSSDRLSNCAELRTSGSPSLFSELGSLIGQ